MNAAVVLDFIKNDDTYMTISIVLLFVTLYGIYYKSKKKSTLNYKELSGPKGLPIVGFLPYAGSKPHETFAELSKKYGPIFKVKMGALPCLVINGFEAIKEAFIKQSENYSGRPNEISFKIYDDEPAFIFDEGPTFKDVRFFSMDILKKLGFGRLSLEPLVKEEVQHLIDEIYKYNGKALDYTHLIEKSVGNAICSILIGKRCPFNDPWLKGIIDSIDGLQRTYVHDYGFFFPYIKKIPFLSLLTNEKEKRYWKEINWKLWEEKVWEVKKETECGILPQNYISHWFQELQARKAKNDPHAYLYSTVNLISNLDIFAQAAFETTSTTIMWSIIYMMLNPETQTKILNEVKGYEANTKIPLTFADAKLLPYTRAFIQEVHRLASIVPLGVFHSTIEATILKGYYVPKKILVMANSYAIHYDPESFPEPTKFKPERFLDEKGEYIRNEKIIPFSIGKRFCPGEYVAQMEIFNYLIQIVTNFELKVAEGCNDLMQSTENTLIRHPLPFKMHFIPRNGVKSL